MIGIGIGAESEGMKRAAQEGLFCMAGGADELLPRSRSGARSRTSSSRRRAPKYEAAGIVAIDLTPAAVGPMVIPPANLRDYLDSPNTNMVTCGGKATIPMVHAVSSVVSVDYVNIDESTLTTKMAIEKVGRRMLGRGRRARRRACRVVCLGRWRIAGCA